jgi:hypothetical protein
MWMLDQVQLCYPNKEFIWKGQYNRNQDENTTNTKHTSLALMSIYYAQTKYYNAQSDIIVLCIQLKIRHIKQMIQIKNKYVLMRLYFMSQFFKMSQIKFHFNFM